MNTVNHQARGRLSRSAEFDRVYRRGVSVQHRLVVLYRFERTDDIKLPEDSDKRIGITVSKKVGNAVERNRLKRQLKEILKTCENLEPGSDYVVIARPGLVDFANNNYSELTQIINDLIQKIINLKPR